MPYRNEVRALQARVERLETELVEARARLHAARDSHAPPSAWLQALMGGPIALQFERVIDGELDETGLEQLVGVLRRELDDVGRTDRVGRTLAWSSRGRHNRLVELTCEVRDGQTRVRVTESLRSLAGALFGGLGGGLGGGGMALVVPLIIETGALVAVPLWMVGVLVLVRSLYRSRSRRRETQLRGLMEKIASDASEHIAAMRLRVADTPAVAAAPARVGLVPEQDAATEQAATDEALAEQQAASDDLEVDRR